MFFSATKATDIVTINKIKSKKISSTLQTKKASDLFINQEYCSNSIDTFPNIKPHSLIFPSVKGFFCPGRTSLSTLPTYKRINGIISIEASISLTIFVLCIASIIYLFNILQLENGLQRRISELARNALLVSTISTEFKDLDDEEKASLKTSSDDSFSILQDLSYSVVNVAYVTSNFFDEDTKELIDSSSIIDGCSGISFVGTHYSNSTDLLTIQINYEVNIPFLSFLPNLPIKQVQKVKLYTGQGISLNKAEDDMNVYITTYGSVYHTTKYCNYLIKYSDVVPVSEIRSLKMEDCKMCHHLRYDSDYLYISETGDKFHYHIDCPVFSRLIYCVKYKSLGDHFTLCERCEKMIN